MNQALWAHFTRPSGVDGFHSYSLPLIHTLFTLQISVKEEVVSGHFKADTESEDLPTIRTPSVINMSPFNSSIGGWGPSRPLQYFDANTHDPHIPIGLPAETSNSLPMYKRHTIKTSYNSHRTSIIKVQPFIHGMWSWTFGTLCTTSYTVGYKLLKCALCFIRILYYILFLQLDSYI